MNWARFVCGSQWLIQLHFIHISRNRQRRVEYVFVSSESDYYLW